LFFVCFLLCSSFFCLFRFIHSFLHRHRLDHCCSGALNRQFVQPLPPHGTSCPPFSRFALGGEETRRQQTTQTNQSG
jgi:hypothetical protein